MQPVIGLNQRVIVRTNAAGPYFGQIGTVRRITDTLGKDVGGDDPAAYAYDVEIAVHKGTETISCLQRDISPVKT